MVDESENENENNEKNENENENKNKNVNKREKEKVTDRALLLLECWYLVVSSKYHHERAEAIRYHTGIIQVGVPPFQPGRLADSIMLGPLGVHSTTIQYSSTQQ